MNRRAFTLIEVVVALVIGGMALSAAVALLDGLARRVDAVRAAAAAEDRDANGERLLRTLLANLRGTTDTLSPLAGDSSRVAFRTWCETSEGWLRPCDAELRIARSDSVTQFDLTLQAGDTSTMTLWRTPLRAGPSAVRYLLDPAHGGTWLTSWAARMPPNAVATITGGDTLIFTTW
jgi:prepilin-type N-terminal cleavage/methylation domain-containing protein